jgi:transcriptional regulator with XRE-family HTH domain
VLAGVSIQYYTRLERGDMSGASEGVLEALARALQLDDAERTHVFDLARAAQPAGARPRRRQDKPRIRPEIQWTLDAITGGAAYVGNDRLDILATNHLGRALFSELYAAPVRPANHVRFASSNRAPRRSTPTGTALVGELATQSEAFRTHWAAHNVRFHATAVKHFHHPAVGELSLSFNRLDVAADHGFTLDACAPAVSRVVLGGRAEAAHGVRRDRVDGLVREVVALGERGHDHRRLDVPDRAGEHECVVGVPDRAGEPNVS